jgi:hypothetical protein
MPESQIVAEPPAAQPLSVCQSPARPQMRPSEMHTRVPSSVSVEELGALELIAAENRGWMSISGSSQHSGRTGLVASNSLDDWAAL